MTTTIQLHYNQTESSRRDVKTHEKLSSHYSFRDRKLHRLHARPPTKALIILRIRVHHSVRINSLLHRLEVVLEAGTSSSSINSSSSSASWLQILQLPRRQAQWNNSDKVIRLRWMIWISRVARLLSTVIASSRRGGFRAQSGTTMLKGQRVIIKSIQFLGPLNLW